MQRPGARVKLEELVLVRTRHRAVGGGTRYPSVQEKRGVRAATGLPQAGRRRNRPCPFRVRAHGGRALPQTPRERSSRPFARSTALAFARSTLMGSMPAAQSRSAGLGLTVSRPRTPRPRLAPRQMYRECTAVSEASGCQPAPSLDSSGGQARGHDTKEARNEGSRKEVRDG